MAARLFVDGPHGQPVERAPTTPEEEVAKAAHVGRRTFWNVQVAVEDSILRFPPNDYIMSS